MFKTPIFLIMPNCFLFIFVSMIPTLVLESYIYFSSVVAFLSESHILHITIFLEGRNGLLTISSTLKKNKQWTIYDNLIITAHCYQDLFINTYQKVH